MRIRTFSIVSGAVTLALVSTSLETAAFAQLLNKPVGTVEQAKAARRSLEGGAQCLLDERPSNVRTFLKMFPASKDAARSANYLNQGDCVDGSAGSQDIHFGPTMLRGALYKALYAREFGGTAPALDAAPLNVAADTSGQDAEQVRLYSAARAFGECVVRKDPEHARALVLAGAETLVEIKALTDLRPTTEACAKPGLPDVTRATYAGLIAEVLYRLSRSAKGGNA